ncbi:MAG: hypothetical protein FWE18_04115 [Alphaproteobacteria bacterium]|nr:hypothetical protein [Alphaproteobacteria bacterium]
MEFDNKYLIAQLCDSKKLEDFKVLLDFYRFLSNIFYKTKDYNLYQIKLQWLLDTLFADKENGAAEVDKFKILMHKYGFDSAKIIKMIESKTADMDNFPFKSIEDSLKYIDNTDGIFWQLYAEMLFGKLRDNEGQSISNMAKSFGIMEMLKFAEFKKSRGVYVLLFSAEDLKDVAAAEGKNIKYLVSIAKGYIKESSKNKGRLRKLLLLNYFSADFFSCLESARFNIDNPAINNVRKLTYLKIVLALIFRM